MFEERRKERRRQEMMLTTGPQSLKRTKRRDRQGTSSEESELDLAEKVGDKKVRDKKAGYKKVGYQCPKEG